MRLIYAAEGRATNARNFTVQASATIPLLDSVIFIRAQRLVHGQTRMPWQSLGFPPAVHSPLPYVYGGFRARPAPTWVDSLGSAAIRPKSD